MTQDQNIRDAVRNLLSASASAGQQCPSIRAIRAKIGKGSFGTISEIVNQWKQEQLQSRGDMPERFESKDAEKIIAVIWEIVAPLIRDRIESVEKRAQQRIDIEHAEADKVREAADEVLAEAENKDRQIIALTEQVKSLTEELARRQGALEQAQQSNESLRNDNKALHEALDKALQEAARATAALESAQRLLPFLDPKHLDKVNVQ